MHPARGLRHPTPARGLRLTRDVHGKYGIFCEGIARAVIAVIRRYVDDPNMRLLNPEEDGPCYPRFTQIIKAVGQLIISHTNCIPIPQGAGRVLQILDMRRPHTASPWIAGWINSCNGTQFWWRVLATGEGSSPPLLTHPVHHHHHHTPPITSNRPMLCTSMILHQ